MGLRRAWRKFNYRIQLERFRRDVQWDLRDAARNPEQYLERTLEPSVKASIAVNRAGERLGLTPEQIRYDKGVAFFGPPPSKEAKK